MIGIWIDAHFCIGDSEIIKEQGEYIKLIFIIILEQNGDDWY